MERAVALPRLMFNKNFVTLFILTVIVVFACYTNQAEAKLVEKGLVSYWSLNEIKGKTVPDDWGENDGTIEGAEIAKGKYGNALQFDGQDNYVNCGNDESLDITDAISIVVLILQKNWFRYAQRLLNLKVWV